ncbi:MAG TPA: saccharopine dehydrogenase NADP-binding domain-containing protein [Povalibacter sp.]|nr:saccharopine dehydrogenase NADP-binding domain-containing protein [Povalibacter sp.]
MSRERAYRILILGGYGHFGARIAQALVAHAGAHLIVAGRDLARAQASANGLAQRGPASAEGACVDAGDPQLTTILRSLAIDLVIHTAGPFQQQSYHVAQACIDAGAHYVDLADGRQFVAGIVDLDAAARGRGVLIVSGASTVPALSAAVIDHYRDRFAAITDIAVGITPGNRTPRGLSTVESVLSYCGKPLQRWQNGRWQRVYGWQDLHRVRYPRLGWRWFATCDVPDLALFPQRYGASGSVRFHAGLELAVIQFSLWLMSWLSRWRLVSSWLPAAPALKHASEWVMGWGSDAGGMHVDIAGRDTDGRQRTLRWILTAFRGHGPQIPCVAAIVIARKLMHGELSTSGATPCLDLMTLAEFDATVQGLDIGWREEWS